MYGGGVLCYLAGMGVVCLVTVSLFLPPDDPVADLSGPYLLALSAGVALLLLGQVVLRRAGDGSAGMAGVPGPPRRRPEPTTLERLGYRRLPDSDDDPTRESTPGEEGTGVVCRECGARNERGFDYCRNCSAELPEA